MLFPLALSLSLSAAHAAVALLPDPFSEPARCGQSAAGPICDPEHFLGSPATDLLQRLETLRREPLVRCPNGEERGLEVAVAVVRNLGRPLDDDEKARVAAREARQLHDSWGVGDPNCGNNGILVFLSIEDRQIYISHGAAFDGGILAKYRLSEVVGAMKPACRRRDYAAAVEDGLKLVRGFVVQGPPSYSEAMYQEMLEWLPLVCFFGIVGLVFYVDKRRRWHQRQYDEARDRLTDLERHRAEALAGRYQQSSCPICLENFKTPPRDPLHETQVHLLGQPMIGSDGRPCRMLRCGHLFDETCFREWIRANPNSATKCPICRQDIRGNGSDDPPDASRRRPLGFGLLPGRADRNMALYQPELEFRIRRLRNRYPRYIDEGTITRWMQPGYQGGFVQDPAFTARDPSAAVATTKRSTGSSYSSSGYSSFGGGSSSGGGGGSW